MIPLDVVSSGFDVVRMLEDGCKRPQRTPHLPHQESCKYSGQRPSLTNILSPVATKTAWEPSSYEGHGDGSDVMRRESSNISHIALHWTPQWKRKRGRPKNTWCRNVEGELKALHHTWGTVQKLAQNRQEWGTFVAALLPSRYNGMRERVII